MTQSLFRVGSVRNKKLLIWDFMEELLEFYFVARRKGFPTVFKIRHFKSTRFPIFAQDESFIFQTLREYEQQKGLIRIRDGTVTLTSKALLLSKKFPHDWD
jgi:hypothetical protein